MSFFIYHNDPSNCISMFGLVDFILLLITLYLGSQPGVSMREIGCSNLDRLLFFVSGFVSDAGA
jgi:hypothetical protein